MQLRKRNIFTTIRAEGSILPADLLQRINDRDAQLKGLTPDDYHLAGGLKLNEAINQSWNRMLGAWAVLQSAREKLPPTDTGTTVTREKWLLPLFQELGYGRLSAAKSIEIEGKSYPISHLWQQTPIHLVSARVDLDTRTAGVAGASRISPHGLTQELLNRSEAHLWGFVSNGLRLRILRDNVSLTRQAYVEFDLEAMMNGEQFPDFMMLWLLCHESRVNAEKPQDCLLERWSKAAHEQGTRALDQLRNGVEEAIKALGRGFLAHPANQTLLGRLRKGELDKQDYYRQLLRLVYRLLFLFVAEDRELLFAPEADEKTRERYTRFYSVSRLRRLAERRLGARHGDQYYGLRLMMQKLGNGGCAELGLPALGSFLFSEEAVADLNGCELANHDLLEAVRALAFITDGHRRRTVDYKNLRSEELGSVYEALLELHPEINAEARQFNLASASGNERKTTGSYYTPVSLVQCLLDSALDPVLVEAAKQPDAEQAILRLKVVDPACGSGHFLIAAAHRMAKRLATVRTGDDEPAPEAVRTALRDVIGRCIYGVDINPMAVELCKVSLWMEALEPGKPLSFLEHRIQCGNALIGTTPALLKKGVPDEAFKPIEGDDREWVNEYRKRNRQERKDRRRPLIDESIKLGNLAASIAELDAIDDRNIAGIRAKQQRYEELVRSSGYVYGQFLADAWSAAFVWKKTREFPYSITEAVFREIEQNPFTHGSLGSGDWLFQEVKRLTGQYQFFHWHLAFPDVFRAPVNDEERENEHAGWSGGFDVVLGNPPWDKIQPEEQKFFAGIRPDIANAKTSVLRKRLIEDLPNNDATTNQLWIEHKRKIEATSHIVKNAGFYTLSASGNLNTYRLFSELASLILNTTGRTGMIVQSGIATDESGKEFFSTMLKQKRLARLLDFENREGFFPAVDSRFRFSLMTLLGIDSPASGLACEFGWVLGNLEELKVPGRLVYLDSEDLSLFNPNSGTCPTFKSQRDVEINRRIYERSRHLYLNEANRFCAIDFQGELFNLTRDSKLFLPAKTMVDGDYYPLYEAKCIHQFDHRFASFVKDEYVECDGAVKDDPHYSMQPKSVVRMDEVHIRATRQGLNHRWMLGFRDIASSTNERTAIFSVFPYSAVGNSINLLLGLNLLEAALILANGNALAFDYACRQKISGTHVNIWIMKQLPAIPIERYCKSAVWDAELFWKWLLPRVQELTYTAHDLRGFAEDSGYTGEPFRWDEERRFLLRCELDAAYFHLYGIGRGDVDYILDTFPIVRRKDEQAHGEYRSKRVILEIYDEMRLAMESGAAYQTRLDPPPANGWTPPEPTREEMVTKSAPQPAETADGKQSDLFKWQAEYPQQRIKFDDAE